LYLMTEFLTSRVSASLNEQQAERFLLLKISMITGNFY